jgi:hypothetical protein
MSEGEGVDLLAQLLELVGCAFVAHTLHLCFALTPSSLEGLPRLLFLSRHMCILCVVAHCALVATILALLLFLAAKISSAFFKRANPCSLFLSPSCQDDHMTCN